MNPPSDLTMLNETLRPRPVPYPVGFEGLKSLKSADDVIRELIDLAPGYNRKQQARFILLSENDLIRVMQETEDSILNQFSVWASRLKFYNTGNYTRVVWTPQRLSFENAGEITIRGFYWEFQEGIHEGDTITPKSFDVWAPGEKIPEGDRVPDGD